MRLNRQKGFGLAASQNPVNLGMNLVRGAGLGKHSVGVSFNDMAAG
jgi:hypothetical protein